MLDARSAGRVSGVELELRGAPPQGHATFVRITDGGCSAYDVPLLIVVLVAFALTMSLTSLVVAALAAPAL